MTVQSDNGKAFVGDLTKELLRRSHTAQAHSTTYHPQTNGLVERQNRTLVNTLRVYCSRYKTDWDKYLPQVVGAYNSTQHSRTVISPFMMLTGGERAMPLAFFYPEYEGKRDVASGVCERSCQETTGIERALQEENGASTNEVTEEIR